MAAKNNTFSFRDQNLNNHFPKGIVLKIWLKVRKYEYINIFKIKFEKKIFCLKMAAKTSFVTLCNNANLCEVAWKWRGRYFFFTKRCVTHIWAITKKKKKKSQKNLYAF